MFDLKNMKLSELSKSFEKLKKSLSEWVVALDTKQYNLQERVKELELRLKQLEEMHGKRIR